MNGFRQRRLRNIVILVILAMAALIVDRLITLSLHRSTILTGWMLLVTVFGLALYNVRKKLSFLSIGSSATWLQIHIYAGLFSIILFGLHIEWRIPTGLLESILALIYVSLIISGIFGIWITRLFAKRLTARGSEVVFEHIPTLQVQIRSEVERLVLQCLSESGSTAIPEIYTNRLKDFFESGKDFWAHLLHASRIRQRLLADLQLQDRYLNETERQIAKQIADEVRKKDDVDYHYAHQAALKYWLFAHIPLTYSLLAFALSHVVLVYAFSGGLR